MTGNADIFNMLMAKYRLTDPLTPEQQAFVLKSRKKVYKAILKKYKKYSILLWFSVATAIIFRGLGIKLTFIQSKVIVALLLTAAATGTSVATYSGAKYIHKKLSSVNQIEEKASLEELKPQLTIPTETAPEPVTGMEKPPVIPGNITEQQSDTTQNRSAVKQDALSDIEAVTGGGAGSATDTHGEPDEPEEKDKAKKHVPVIPSM